VDRQPIHEVASNYRFRFNQIEEESMNQLNVSKVAVIAVFGLVGWALCGAIVFIGREFMPMDTTLIVHAIGAPVIFSAISWIYFTRFSYTKPLTTAALFVGIVIFMDVVLVALVIERSLEMFESLIGTWIPWVLIFFSTYLTGLFVEARSAQLKEA
jgi:hypothetical protein